MSLSAIDETEPYRLRTEKTLSAFILINTEPDSVREVFNDLNKIEAVDKTYIVYGVHDIIVRVSADSIEHLRDVVTTQIRNVNNVNSTLTMTVIDP